MTKNRKHHSSNEDITVLKQKETRDKTILRMAMDGFYIVDTEGRILETNDSYCSMIGYSSEELLKMSVRDVEVLDTQEVIEKRIQQIIGTGSARFETKHRRKDGRVIDIEASVNYLLEKQPKFFCFMRDMTDRKQAEDKLLYFQMAVDSATDAIGMSTPAGRHYYQNEAYTKLFGLSVREVDGVSGPPATVYADEKVGRKVFDIIMNGGSFAGEVKMLDKDRKERDIYLRAYSIKNKAGKVVGLVGVHNDITDRKRAEELLREQKSFTENLIENSAFATFVLNPKHKILLWNKACEALTGFRASDMIGSDNQWKPFYAYRRPTLADCIIDGDFDRVPLLYEKSSRSVLVANGLQAEGWYINLNGRDRYVIFDSSPVYNSKGELIVVIETLQDITDRKHAEEKLRQSEEFNRNILETVDEGFIIIDPDYRIVSANRAYCKQIKCKTENIIGKHCHEVSHHKDKPCFSTGEECAPSRTFKTGKPSLAIHTHYDSENKPIYLETRSYPVKDRSGAITAVIETLNNITELRRLEEQLRHAQKMEAIGTLAGGIAHDFNNILTVIIGYGSLMQKQMKSDNFALPYLKEILAAGERAAQLTRGLLAFSRKQVMDLQPANINSIIANFRKMIERIIGEDIEFRVIASEDLIVNVDAGQIEQVLMNLVANARDAMPRGGMLTIKTESTIMDSLFVNTHGFGKPGSYAVIAVTDTGTGMDDTTRQRIFEPYFTTKELSKGTGLGLSIAFGIVKQHKGFIECQSDLEKGTSFRIYLPLASTVEDRERNEEAASVTGGAETILIAEDDAAVRRLTRQILNEYGYAIIEAVDGEDAVRKFRDNQDRIQLLLFDVIMPKKGGKEAYEDIRDIRPNIKAIFMSGYARDLVQDDGIHDHDAEFLQKPVSQNELLKKIRALLDRQ